MHARSSEVLPASEANGLRTLEPSIHTATWPIQIGLQARVSRTASFRRFCVAKACRKMFALFRTCDVNCLATHQLPEAGALITVSTDFLLFHMEEWRACLYTMPYRRTMYSFKLQGKAAYVLNSSAPLPSIVLSFVGIYLTYVIRTTQMSVRQTTVRRCLMQDENYKAVNRTSSIPPSVMLVRK